MPYDNAHSSDRAARSERLPSPRTSHKSVTPLALYTAAERARRDATPWTLVQGILAPVQFLIFAISLVLVVRFLVTGQGHGAAAISVVVKTLALYAIMVTGCIWEKVVFGRYLFAPMFFWEDVFSMLVLTLHTTYLIALAFGLLGDRALMLLALTAYATYAINAAQFIVKLRMARRGGVRPTPQDEAMEWAEWAA
jgi:3-vinyl bacteriochlorophyllide hydratase